MFCIQKKNLYYTIKGEWQMILDCHGENEIKWYGNWLTATEAERRMIGIFNIIESKDLFKELQAGILGLIPELAAFINQGILNVDLESNKELIDDKQRIAILRMGLNEHKKAIIEKAKEVRILNEKITELHGRLRAAHDATK